MLVRTRRNWKPHAQLVGMVRHTLVSPRIKYRVAIKYHLTQRFYSSIYILKRTEMAIHRKTCKHMFMTLFCQASVCSSVFVSSQQRSGVKDIKAPLGMSQLSGLGHTML